nr:rrna-processing protein fcf2 [Quercus suber]
MSAQSCSSCITKVVAAFTSDMIQQLAEVLNVLQTLWVYETIAKGVSTVCDRQSRNCRFVSSEFQCISNMAATLATPVAATNRPGDGDLTDEQIEALLARAAARLSQNPKNAEPDHKFSFPRLNTGPLAKPYITTGKGIAQLDSARLLDSKYRQQANGGRKVEDPIATKKLAVKQKEATAGNDWYNLPRTDLTPELKRDLQLLKMRNVLDPHRHYKKDGGKMKAPEFSQMGTIVEGPTEFFSGRIENKQRKRTFAEEVLANEKNNGRFKRKYGELQEKKTSGKKAFYKSLKDKRKSGKNKGAG